MTELLTPLDAAHLARSYHDAMSLVNDPRHPYHPQTNPRRVLETYLQACKMCRVRLHNDAWESRAETLVDQLMAARRKAFAEALKIGAGAIL